jgi:glutamate-1-semialdehyde aminotransferase
MGKGQKLYKKAKRLIPGGTQLLSKRPEMFLPEIWPSYYKKAKGVVVEDLDDNKYIDMSIFGIGACILGYADEDVDSAVKQAITNGVASSLNCPEEVELAEFLCDIHPWAEMVRFTRSGGEAVAMAIRIARAATGRDKIAFSGYHGWCDWYLAANLGEDDSLDGQLMPGLDPAGVPRGLIGTALPFHYNDLGELKKIVTENKGELAAIIMEPQRGEEPKPGFLESIREIASSINAVLIFDEVTSGFRINNGGIHLTLGVNPDMAVFAKAMANGYAMAAVIGKEEIMEAAQSTFISSTNWTERIGPVAALATIKKFERENVAEHLIKTGSKVQKGWKEIADELGLKIKVTGIPPLSHFSFEYENDLAISTFFTQEMLKKGFLAWTQFKPSFAHQDVHLEKYLKEVNDVFRLISKAIQDNQVEKLLEGPIAQRGFHRLTKS